MPRAARLALHKAIDILDSPPGMSLLAHLRAMTARFRAGPRETQA
jgi:glycine C-acetyltransferase